MEKTINSVKIKEHLLSNEGDEKLIVLFGDSKEKRNISNKLGESLRSNPVIVTNRNVSFRAQNNLLELGSRKVIFGLVADEKFLLSHYSEGIIHYYKAGDNV